MSVKRSPTISVSNAENRNSTPSSNKNTQGEDDPSTPQYVFHRNKRTRAEDTSPLTMKFQTFKTEMKDEMKDLLTSLLSEQNKQLTKIANDLKEMQNINYNIEQSIGILTTQNEDFRCKIELLETQAKKDREYITILEDKVEDLQRSSRKSSVELKNVPKKPNETRDDLIGMVLKLSENIQLDLNARDISDIFRLKPRQESAKNPTIIVELRSSILRSDLLKKTKEFSIRNKIKLQAKHLGHTTQEDTPVFLSEQLTAKGARLFFLARDLSRTNGFKYCWTSFGRVYLRKDDKSKIIHIQSEAQVQQLHSEK